MCEIHTHVVWDTSPTSLAVYIGKVSEKCFIFQGRDSWGWNFNGLNKYDDGKENFFLKDPMYAYTAVVNEAGGGWTVAVLWPDWPILSSKSWWACIWFFKNTHGGWDRQCQNNWQSLVKAGNFCLGQEEHICLNNDIREDTQYTNHIRILMKNF